MAITNRVFNYVDAIKYVLQHTFSITEEQFYIIGEITEEQRQRQKKQDWFIVLSGDEQQPIISRPKRIIQTLNEQTYEAFLQKFTQNIKINVLSYQTSKPDIAYCVANNCRSSLFTELGTQYKILNQHFNVMSVGGIKNFSFIESDAQDQVQRYQFDVKLYYELLTQIDSEVKKATLMPPKFITCK